MISAVLRVAVRAWTGMVATTDTLAGEIARGAGLREHARRQRFRHRRAQPDIRLVRLVAHVGRLRTRPSGVNRLGRDDGDGIVLQAHPHDRSSGDADAHLDGDSAVLLEAGVIVLAIGLVRYRAATLPGAILILAGFGSFLTHVRDIVKRKLPPPAALPRPDWATWQTHVAFGWLLLAAITGLVLTLPTSLAWTVPLGWIYGTAGLVGFLAQIVVGIQGRLLPLHGWYRVLVTGGMKPPRRSAHSLGSHRLARWILLTWTFGVPLLAGGLAVTSSPLVRLGSACLLAGVILNAAQATVIATAQADSSQ